MPLIKSAIKRVRTSNARHTRNVAVKSAVRKQTKQTLAAITAGDATTAREQLRSAISQLDKAAKHGTLHANTAARRKSALTRQYNTIAKVAYGTEPASKKPAAKAATKTTAAKSTTKSSGAKAAKPAAQTKTQSTGSPKKNSA